MLVSNFELLIKRIATVPSTIPASISAVFRRVVQGYFLNVTNLDEARTGAFFLRITITNSTGNRIINNANTQCFFDNGNTNNQQLNINSVAGVGANILQFTTSVFRLRPKQTGLITLLPNVIPFITNPNPDLEIRGYVELVQSRFTGDGPFITIGAIPAKEVLVTPEIRGTFLDNAYPSNNPNDELDFDQIAYGLPTANGQALGTVEKIPPLIFDFERPPAPDGLVLANPDLTLRDAEGILQMVKDIEVAKKKK